MMMRVMTRGDDARVAVRDAGRSMMRARSVGTTRSVARGRARTMRTMSAMRPYTVRRGDTVDTIASKRSMSAKEVRRINKSLESGGEPAAGTTILLPAEKLSKRDREIIDGIRRVNEPRVYPVRAGERVEEIIAARKITLGEFERLNPKVGAAPKAGTKVLLPPGRYTVREREMLQGCGILPADTINPLSVLWTPVARNVLLGVVALGAYAMYFAACRRYQDHGTKLWGNDRPPISDD